MTTEDNSGDDDDNNGKAAQAAKSLRQRRKPNPTKKELIEEFRNQMGEIGMQARMAFSRTQMLTQETATMALMIQFILSEVLEISKEDFEDEFLDYVERIREEMEEDDDIVESTVPEVEKIKSKAAEEDNSEGDDNDDTEQQ